MYSYICVYITYMKIKNININIIKYMYFYFILISKKSTII